MKNVKMVTLFFTICTGILAAASCFAGDVVLQDFESGGAFLNPRIDEFDVSKKVVSSAAMNEQWSSSGKKSLQLSFQKYEIGQPEWPGISLYYASGDYKVKDWSGYGQFAIDIKNDCPNQIHVSVEIRSAKQNGYTQSIDIAPNSQGTLTIDLQAAWKKSRFVVDIRNIIEIIIYSTRPKEAWKYSVDNMRLIDNKSQIEFANKIRLAEIAIDYLYDSKLRDEFTKQLKEISDEVNDGRLKSGPALNSRFGSLMQKIMAARYRNEWFFNFGPADKQHKDGWKYVSPAGEFAISSGYGWVGKPQLSAKEFEGQTTWGFRADRPYIKSRQAPPIFLNEQQAGFVFSKQPADFRVTLPNGDYRVMLITGYPGEDMERFCPVDMTVNIQGKPHRITLAERKIFKTHIFDANVTDKALNINFRTNTDHDWVINAIAIWPVGDNERAWSEFVSPLRDHINIMPEQERAELLNDMRTKPAPRTNVPAEYTDYGFAPFAAQELTDYTMAYTPDKYGIDGGLSTRVAKNETATMTFGLLPLANAPFHLKIVPSELKSKDGVIPAADVRVRMVENLPWPPDQYTRKGMVEWPRLLQGPYEGTWQWRPWQASMVYVTVKLPAGIKAGEYEGTLNISAGDKKTLTVPLKLTVLPVELQMDPQLTYSAYWYWYLEKNEARVRSEFANMRDHGFNMIPTWRVSVKGTVKDGKIEWTIGAPDKIIGILKEYGLLRPIPFAIETQVRFAMKELHNVQPIKCPVDVPVPAKFYDNITQLVAKIEKWRKANDLPEVYYYTMDEICDYKLAYKLGAAVKKVPGAKLFSNSNTIIQKQLGNLVDLSCYSYEGFITEENLHKEIMARKNAICWTYPNTALSSPRVAARMLWGLTGRKIGFKGLWPWAYMSPAGSPNSPYDGLYTDYMLAYPEIDSPIDTVAYEEARCGIDDGRYYDTALAMIDKLRATKTPQNIALADSAQKEIDTIMNEVTYTYLDDESMQYGRDKTQQWRNKLQDIVLRLNDALNAKN